MMELINELVSKLGVKEEQAKGGAGLIFKLAQEKLGTEFSAIAQAVPGAAELISGAPKTSGGGAMQLLTGLLGSLGGDKAKGLSDLATLASGFTDLNLDKQMVSQFIPIVLEFVKNKGGEDILGLITKVLQK